MLPTQDTQAAAAAVETCVSRPPMCAASLPTGPVPATVDVAFFASVFDQVPTVRTVAWHRLVDRLCRFPSVSTGTIKRDQPCWAPVRFRAAHSSRAVDVESVGALVLDLDGGLSINAALERTTGLDSVVHTSWSHTPDSPRFRLVLPLARPVPGARWADAWNAAVDALGLPADPACKNANRRFLLPVQPPGAPIGFVTHRQGVALDLLALAPMPRRVRGRSRRTLTIPPRRREAVMQALLRREPESRRRLGEHLGGHRCGEGEAERVEGLPCPACGRPSAWFWVAPLRATRARCQHRNSCGWDGPLTDFVGAA